MWTTPCFLCTSYGRADLPQHCQNASAVGALMVSILGLSQWDTGGTPQACWFSPYNPFSLRGSQYIGEGPPITQYPSGLNLGEEWWRALSIIYGDVWDNGQKQQWALTQDYVKRFFSYKRLICCSWGINGLEPSSASSYVRRIISSKRDWVTSLNSV